MKEEKLIDALKIANEVEMKYIDEQSQLNDQRPPIIVAYQKKTSKYKRITIMVAAIIMILGTVSVAATREAIEFPHYDKSGFRIAEYSPGMIIDKEEVGRYMANDIEAWVLHENTQKIEIQVEKMLLFVKEMKDESYKGWKLRKGDTVEWEFGSSTIAGFPSDNKDKIVKVGYVYDGKIHEITYQWDDENAKGKAEFVISERGEYYFFLLNCCSEDLDLEINEIKIMK